MALANGIGLLQAGYPENEPGSVPHLPPIRRPVVPDSANVPTAKGVLNSNFSCGQFATYQPKCRAWREANKHRHQLFKKHT
jgi:hypothetical protein